MKNAPLQSDFAAAKNLLLELGKVSDRPNHLIETRCAELIRDLREVYTIFFSAQSNAVKEELNIKVRQAAIDLLVHLHSSLGHPIPGVFEMPKKSLTELLNDLEALLFTEVVARKETGGNEPLNGKAHG